MEIFEKIDVEIRERAGHVVGIDYELMASVVMEDLKIKGSYGIRKKIAQIAEEKVKEEIEKLEMSPEGLEILEAIFEEKEEFEETAEMFREKIKAGSIKFESFKEFCEKNGYDIEELMDEDFDDEDTDLELPDDGLPDDLPF